MDKRIQVVFDVRKVGQGTVIGCIAKYFDRKIPDSVFKWDNSIPKEYEFWFVVPPDEMEFVARDCAELELRDFIIISNEGMRIGG